MDSRTRNLERRGHSTHDKGFGISRRCKGGQGQSSRGNIRAHRQKVKRTSRRTGEGGGGWPPSDKVEFLKQTSRTPPALGVVTCSSRALSRMNRVVSWARNSLEMTGQVGPYDGGGGASPEYF